MKSRKQNLRSTRAKSIAVIGITLAIMILLQLFSSLLQKLGMPMSLALGLIPVLVVSQTHGIKYGAISGFFFGLFTLVFSIIYMGAIPMYKVTANPLVSVFPRIMVGVVCSLAYGGFMRIAQNRDSSPSLRKRRLTTISISAASTILGVMTNTLLFLGMFFAFAHGRKFDDLIIDFKWILSSIVALNTVIELALFTVIVPSVVYAMTQSRLSIKFGISNLYANSSAYELDASDDSADDPIDEDTDCKTEEKSAERYAEIIDNEIPTENTNSPDDLNGQN